MDLYSTSEPWNVTPPKRQPVPWEGGKEPGAKGAQQGMYDPTPHSLHGVSHLERTSFFISAHFPLTTMASSVFRTSRLP